MPESVFDELKRYVHFGDADERALRALHVAALPRLGAVVDAFYERISAHEGASRALSGGENQVRQLKTKLRAWLDTLLRGPWDAAYWERRTLIGRVHVRIGLPQHYMFGAMNLVRGELGRIAWERFHADPGELEGVREALGKILDIELAVMLDTYRDDLLAQQARVERLSTFGQLVASIGHDLRTPLAVIETSAYLLHSRAAGDERASRLLDRISAQVATADGIVTHLLDLVSDRPLATEVVRVADVVRAAADAVRRPDAVGLDLDGLDALPALAGDPVQLRQAFVNLLQNAVQAASPRGSVLVRGRRGDREVDIDVEDTGPGVDPSIRRRLFEPLVTTKRRGIGLGLALVKRIAERHGGSVAYSDRPGGGARFTVRLPLGDGEAVLP